MGGEVYCICRSSDVSRFMICCDHCEEWYHGDCIRVTEEQSQFIKKYYCKKCQSRKPNLQIVFKSKYKEYLAEKKKEKERHGDHDRHGHRDRDKDKERHKEKDRSNDKERHHGEKVKRKETEEERARRKEKERKESSKHRNESKEKSKDLTREKLEQPKLKDFSKHVEKYVKEEKVKLEPKSELDFKPKHSSLKRELSASSDDSFKPGKLTQRKKVHLEDSNDEKPSAKHSSSDQDEDWKPFAFESNSQKKVTKEKPSIKNHKNPATNKRPTKIAPAMQKNQRQRNRHVRNVANSSDDEIPVERQVHCYGRGCTNLSRRGSKYCSDKCGINLASARIMQTLPERVRQWNLTGCAAEKTNRQELETLRTKQDEVRSRLDQLNVEFHTLENLIGKGKSQAIDDDIPDDESEEAIVHCVTCGVDIHCKTAIKHMERCYNKMESQTSFASRFKTSIDDARMFCDFYNPKDETYCKRLKVLCHEHHPDRGFRDDEVCGFPQTDKTDKLTFCRLSKRRCNAHFCWEKLRRAELDMERVRQWMKFDELLEQERQVKLAMSSRAGVLGLLLHSTVNHEIEERFQQHRMFMQQRKQQPLKT